MEQNSVRKLGNRLNELRIQHKLTYIQWAEVSGVPEGTIKSILAGNTASPSFETVCAMLTALDVSIDEFYGGTHSASQMPRSAPEPLSERPSYTELARDMKTVARDAMEAVGRDETIRMVRRELIFWRFLAIGLVAVIVIWLQWDIRHPNAGLIQYGYVVPDSQGHDGNTSDYALAPMLDVLRLDG